MFYIGAYIKKDPDLLSVIEAFEKQYGVPEKTQAAGGEESRKKQALPD